MTVGINIQPFLASMMQLRTLTAGQGGVIDANAFMRAGEQLHASLDPAHVPGMSQERRDAVLSMFRQLIFETETNGHLLKKPTTLFLTVHLRAAGFFPNKAVLANEDAVHDFLESLAATSQEAVADSIQSGGIHVHRDPRETLLGGLDDDGEFDDTLVIGALRSGGFHIGRPALKTLLAGSVPPPADDFDSRVTLQKYAPPKPLTAQPIIDVAPVLGEPAPVASSEAPDEETTAVPLGPPPDRTEWQDVWQSYRKGESSLADFLDRYRRGQVPIDFLHDALQGAVIPYEAFLTEVAEGRLPVQDFLDLFFECAFPLEPLAEAVRAGKVPLFSSNRESVEQKLAELGPFSGRDSLRGYLRRVETGDLPLETVRVGLQEGLIPYRDLVQELADGALSPQNFYKTFREGAIPAQPLLMGLREGRLPATLLIEAFQDAVRGGKIPFETLLQAMQEGNLPQVNAKTGRLLIQQPLYLNRTGQTVPTVIESDYQLIDELGTGGTSIVHRALEKDTEREVAIKIVTNRAKKEKIYKGFLEEIRHAPFSDSPRFVKVYATGLTAQDEPFAVMEMLRGGALSDFVTKMNAGLEAFDLQKMMKLACQVVAAVAEMHEHGYIHRDIKTENYFLDEKGNAKLGDQGLRKKVTDIAAEPPEDGLWGTPGAMPPEKVRAEAPDSEVTDTFALGVTLYELFTGVFCFQGDTQHGRSALAIMNNAIVIQPEKPSEVCKRLKFPREIPEALNDIIMKCLEKDPSKRYPNAIAVLYDLVTVQAKQLEREANESLKQTPNHTGAEDQINEDIWQEKIQQAIQELHSVYNQYPEPGIRRKLVELNFALYEWADRVGNEKEIARTSENIQRLEPQSEEAAFVRNNMHIKVRFLIQGSRPKGSHIGVKVRHHNHRAGYFEFNKTRFEKEDLPRIPLSLERGGVYAAQLSVPGMVSFIRDLPVRPGDYSPTLPFYPLNKVPAGWILIPEGRTAARTSRGSFAEKFEDKNWRQVPHNIAMGPLVTNGAWYNYIKRLAAEDPKLVEGRMPSNWNFDFFDAAVHKHNAFLTRDGEPINWKTPVAYITRPQALEFLADYTKFLKEQGYEIEGDVRFPTLYEWRRSFRPDPREWPHGDSNPRVGDIAIRIRDPRGSGPIKLLPIDAPVRDVSPFSVLKDLTEGEAPRVVKHIVGNVQKFLHIGGEDDHARISRALGLVNGQLGTEFMATAGADCSMSPADPDILNRHPSSASGLIGILPVIQLRPPR